MGNPTGAGDAVVAALVHGLIRRQAWPDRLRHAAALGAATVAAPAAGEFHTGTYQRRLAEVRVTEPAGPGSAQPDTGRSAARPPSAVGPSDTVRRAAGPLPDASGGAS